MSTVTASSIGDAVNWTAVSGLFSPTEWAYLALFLAVPVLVAVAGWLASRRAPEEMVSRQIRESREAGGAR